MSDQVVLYFQQSGKEVDLTEDKTIAGRRKETCDLYLPRYFDKGDKKSISREHFEIKRGSSGWLITDLGSTNGTEVDGRALDKNRPKTLRDGSQVRLAGDDLLVINVTIFEDQDRTIEPFSDSSEKPKKRRGIDFDEQYNQFIVDGEAIPLTYLSDLEFKLLKHLYHNAGIPCSHYEIGQNVWRTRVSRDNISAMVYSLRQKLNRVSDGAGKRYIKANRRRQGYMLELK